MNGKLHIVLATFAALNLAACAEEGASPETAYKGSLNVRFKNSEIHRRAAVYAIMHEQSLNSFIEDAVEEKLARG